MQCVGAEHDDVSKSNEEQDNFQGQIEHSKLQAIEPKTPHPAIAALQRKWQRGATQNTNRCE